MLNAGTPIRFFFSGDKEAAKGRCRDADVMLYQLKNIQQAGGDIQTLQRRFADGTTIKVHTKVNGIDTSEIFVPPKGFWELVEEYETSSIVPILEMSTLSLIDAGEDDQEYTEPICFAAYDISEEKITSLIDTTFDIGETPDTDTTKVGTCKISTSSTSYTNNEKIETEITVEELKRYDESYTSFLNRDFYTEPSCLELAVNWDTDYYECDPVTHETFFDPGRRPDDFPALAEWEPCGYDGYYGDFAYIVRGSEPFYCDIHTGISLWWPPNFKQVFKHNYTEKTTSWIYAYADGFEPRSDFSEIFERTDVYNDNRTYYGIVWDLGIADDINVDENNNGDPNGLIVEYTGEGFNTWRPSDVIGTYLRDNKKAYIFSGTKCGKDFSYRLCGYEKGRRNARDPIIHFGTDELTSDQLKVLEGNNLPDVGETECQIYKGVDPNLYWSSETGEYFKSEIETGMYYFINICGNEYILQEALLRSYVTFGDYPDRQQFIKTYYISSTSDDVGIFADSTKHSDEIEPKDFVYVYSLSTEDFIRHTNVEYLAEDPPNRIGWIGFVYQENHYVMGPMDNMLEKHVAYKNNDGIKTQEGEQLYFTGFIRAGKKTEKVKKYKWTQL